ncbi:hypothetical protein GPECTOR_47g315 [Gonium pectorale]|uniref:Ankyrin repeat domain-containing protein n=1 Tax=Gonium pectorale TaxID=33097 RepID=A0A150G9L4_GONPE|nr:hypothetical protein GPECTOR_47g315 [Gonium pectorale]|eukprot:KXZ46040.1 hypothetical protein GPECTOR_47g315 [Gonium pectorale]
MDDLAAHWLLPGIAERVASFMDHNEVVLNFSRVDGATWTLRSRGYQALRLSQPVPPHVFSAHWLAPGATRCLTLARRRQLMSLTAASGVVANLDVAHQAAGCLLTYKVFEAAAAAGKLASCQWLLEHGCPTFDPRCMQGSNLLSAAASGGHRHVCEWLLGLDPRFNLNWTADGAAAAAHRGHVAVMDWLLWRRIPVRQTRSDHNAYHAGALLFGAAIGCDLPTLQRLWPGRSGRGGIMAQAKRSALLEAAAGSPTPDWQAKVEWLEAQGCTPADCVKAAACPDAPARLAWLRGRGYRLDRFAVSGAAGAANMPALQYLLDEVGVSPEAVLQGALMAATCGHLAVLQALHAAGAQLGRLALDVGVAAAKGGHLQVLAWLVETLGRNVVLLDARLFSAAAESGSVQMLAWLRERGCAWHQHFLGDPYTGAAESGCEEALEWLAGRGCPMPNTGEPYVKACGNRDVATLRCLGRLGVPWGRPGYILCRAVLGYAPPPLLRWLSSQGGPADVVAARSVLRADGSWAARVALSRLEQL